MDRNNKMKVIAVILGLIAGVVAFSTQFITYFIFGTPTEREAFIPIIILLFYFLFIPFCICLSFAIYVIFEHEKLIIKLLMHASIIWITAVINHAIIAVLYNTFIGLTPLMTFFMNYQDPAYPPEIAAPLLPVILFLSSSDATTPISIMIAPVAVITVILCIPGFIITFLAVLPLKMFIELRLVKTAESKNARELAKLLKKDRKTREKVILMIAEEVKSISSGQPENSDFYSSWKQFASSLDRKPPVDIITAMKDLESTRKKFVRELKDSYGRQITIKSIIKAGGGSKLAQGDPLKQQYLKFGELKNKAERVHYLLSKETDRLIDL